MPKVRWEYCTNCGKQFPAKEIYVGPYLVWQDLCPGCRKGPDVPEPDWISRVRENSG